MRRDGFARYCFGVLGYNLLVIAWGAFVRATGSGAGCGAHWPLCDGQVVPTAPSVERMIEFSHRASSGVALVLVLGMAIWSFRARDKGDPARKAAVFSLVFVLTEALIGAGLVLFELVAHDASMKRALSMTLHLTNTFVLLGCLTLTARAAVGAPRLRLTRQGIAPWLALLVLCLTLFLGMSGAIAALGDTLFPAKSLAEGFAQDLSPGAHLFVKLRTLHPMIATLTGAAILGLATLAPIIRPAPTVKQASRLMFGLFAAQFTAGLVNVYLLAPVWMQLVHLLLADAVWISLVLLCASLVRADHAPAGEATTALTQPSS
jgi:heme A synthase